MSGRVFGSGIRRREDPRLITGTATYPDEVVLPGMLYAAMLRNPHAAHGLSRSVLCVQQPRAAWLPSIAPPTPKVS
jgi:CO/xanthine dehydrogenase Mo-binding subunit